MAESFEQALEKLEEIVGQLESGELTLDNSLKSFEAGVNLASRCEKKLEEAEGKIELLLKRTDGTVECEPFGGENDAK